MKITVAICTWNRGDLLSKTLENMLRLKTDDSFTWELLVVNNNCTDNTDEVIAKFSDRLPIKCISEPTPGLSNARNAAVRNASGEYIIWTDDDVLVDENWLLAYRDAFDRYPDAAVFGGPVEPWFEGEPPEWLIQGWAYLDAAFAVRDLGDDVFALKPGTNALPFGANFAMKLSVQDLFPYNPDLGLKAGKILLGEESAVMNGLLEKGYTGWWIPKAKVKHWLPKERQTLDYIKKYFRGYGHTLCNLDIGTDYKCLWGYPRWLLRAYMTILLKYFFFRIFCPKKLWLKSLTDLAVYEGRIYGCRNRKKLAGSKKS